jgi:hypothetical protein
VLPNFLVAGVMKCGTSALVRGMASHPDVYFAPGKEVHFFDREFDRGLDWYESRFAEHGGAVAVGEGTPYVGHERAQKRMLETLDRARIIVILRNPVDRAYSHYWHNRRRGRETLSFGEALAAEQDRLTAGDGEIFGYRLLSRYAEHLEAIDAAAGADRLLVLLNEDLRTDRKHTLDRAWSFVGVHPERGDAGERQRQPSRRTWRTIRHRLTGTHRRQEAYPPLDSAERRSLAAEWEPDMRRLATRLGRDLSHWWS